MSYGNCKKKNEKKKYNKKYKVNTCCVYYIGCPTLRLLKALHT